MIISLSLIDRTKRIEIKETKDYQLLEKLAKKHKQEVSPEITKRIVKGWFAFRNSQIIGGIGIFKWDDIYSLEYSFSTPIESKENVQDKLLKETLLFCRYNRISKVYYIRGAPEHFFPINRFGFKEIHWRNLPPLYRDFNESMCDKCPKEIKEKCYPVAMVLDIKQHQ